MTRTQLALAFTLAAVTCAPALADSVKKPVAADKYGDPAVVAKDVYRLVLENDRIRVFDVTFKPGQKAPMHTHPEHLVYVLANATIKITGPDGKSQDVTLTAGQALMLPAGPHAAENVGKTAAHNLVVELKAGK